MLSLHNGMNTAHIYALVKEQAMRIQINHNTPCPYINRGSGEPDFVETHKKIYFSKSSFISALDVNEVSEPSTCMLPDEVLENSNKVIIDRNQSNDIEYLPKLFPT